MNTKLKLITICHLLSAICYTASAQGTAFTYQGRLNSGTNPASGNYDLTFSLFSTAGGAGQVGNSVTNSTGVSNGLFTATLDFGANFPGADRWLEIGVRTNGGGTFTTLSPRQKLTPTPYAVFASAASNLSGALPAGQLSGTILNASLPASPNFPGTVAAGLFSGNGANVANVNAVTLNGLTSSGFWKTSGNIGANPTNGAFVGTTDNMPLEIRVSGQRALRLEVAYDSLNGSVAPNVIGGYSGNLVSNSFFGATIIGGGNFFYPNIVGNRYAAVLGGLGNIASGIASTAMGWTNNASGNYSTAMGHHTIASGTVSATLGVFTVASGGVSTAMGSYTTASADYSTAMGWHTVASGWGSTAMGIYSTASGDFSTVNGYYTTASGYSSTAMGHLAQATNDGTFVWADSSSFDRFTSTATNQFLIRAIGGVGINKNNPSADLDVNGEIHWGFANQLSLNQSGSIELGDSTDFATRPFIDFHYGVSGAQDYNTRIINDGDRQLSIFRGGSSTPMARFTPSGLTVNGTFVSSSDRNVKENFQPLSTREVLNKVAAMPITRWNYKEDKDSQHVGPMAQDFYAAFQVGPDDKHITTVDEGGVALAAIQGLNQKVDYENEKLREELKRGDAENANLRREMSELKSQVVLLKRILSENKK